MIRHLILQERKMKSWDELRVFLEVARRGTLTEAAGVLGMNASTVHRRLAALEVDEGVPLFEKSPRGYRLTEAGEALLPRVLEAEEAVLTASRTLRGHDREASGTVRVTLPSDLLPLLAPHLLAFRSAHPNITPLLFAQATLMDLGRAADVALRISASPPEAAIGRRIAPVHWAPYAPHAVPERELPWLDYQGFEQVEPVAASRKQYRDPIARVDGVEAMLALLRCSGCWGLLPCYVGDAVPALIRLGEPEPTSAFLWVLVHADLKRAARVRAWVDFVVPRLLAQQELFAGTVRPAAH